MARNITQSEYQASLQHGYAGTVASLLPETVAAFLRDPEWDGQHWQLHNAGPQGTVLSPVNIR